MKGRIVSAVLASLKAVDLSDAAIDAVLKAGLRSEEDKRAHKRDASCMRRWTQDRQLDRPQIFRTEVLTPAQSARLDAGELI